MCDHRAEAGERKGKVPTPVEGGTTVGDHLVEVLRVTMMHIQCKMSASDAPLCQQP